MSNGYLVISKKNIDQLEKNRYMKFDKQPKHNNLNIYTRMEYLNQQHCLVDYKPNHLFCLSQYSIAFFEELKCNDIYFIYFALKKGIVLESIIKKTCQSIIYKKTTPLPLCNNKNFIIDLNAVYQIYF